MRRINWRLKLGIALVISSVFFYCLHYLIFRDAYHIFFYLLDDIAFIPIEVLAVTLIIHKILTDKEKRILLEKLNMLVGTFFSEIGTKLIIVFSDNDPNLEQIKSGLIIDKNWDDAHFTKVAEKLKKYDYTIKIKDLNLESLFAQIAQKRDFLVRLLENPNLLEHETFTELLRAVFHLAEELAARKTLKNLPNADLEHIQEDIKRAYNLLVREWIDYMKYLKSNYPYLFSLAIRTNPFDEKATPVIG